MNVYKVNYTKVALFKSPVSGKVERGSGIDGSANVLGENPSAAGDSLRSLLATPELEINVSAVHEIGKDVLGGIR